MIRQGILETPRMILRRPRAEDAQAIFDRYASDPEVTRYMGWPRHRSVEDTKAFLAFSEEQWERWPAGPYLVESRDDGRLLGSTGYAFESAGRASTGYVFARDSWGRGYATEALRTVVEHAPGFGIRHLIALCHAGHRASYHVLEKSGFRFERLLLGEFPNLEPGHFEVRLYAIDFD